MCGSSIVLEPPDGVVRPPHRLIEHRRWPLIFTGVAAVAATASVVAVGAHFGWLTQNPPVLSSSSHARPATAASDSPRPTSHPPPPSPAVVPTTSAPIVQVNHTVTGLGPGIALVITSDAEALAALEPKILAESYSGATFEAGNLAVGLKYTCSYTVSKDGHTYRVEWYANTPMISGDCTAPAKAHFLSLAP